MTLFFTCVGFDKFLDMVLGSCLSACRWPHHLAVSRRNVDEMGSAEVWN